MYKRQVPKGSKVNLVISDGARPRKVPADLAGKNALDVAQALEKVSLKPVVERVQDPSVQLGYVVSVEPASGTEVEFESEVKVRVSSPRDKAIVPDVAGKSTLQADADPVSYTHLDVYKRQAYRCTGRSRH